MIPFELCSDSQFLRIENGTLSIEDFENQSSELLESYIDTTATAKCNTSEAYRSYNTYVPGKDITLEELKKFRTWFATELLDKVEWTAEQRHMLEYYSGGMYDEVVKWLGSIKITYDTNNNKPCGCGGSTDISSLYVDKLSVCDSESLYRSNIKNLMIYTFSDINIWTQLQSTFVAQVKEYIDNIIKANLSFVTYTTHNTMTCDCFNSTSQDWAIEILRSLSIALNYIIDDDIDGHKNYIYNSLNKWSTELYELMEWN